VAKALKSLPVNITLVPGAPFAGLGVRVGLGTECLAVAAAAVPTISALTVLSLDGIETSTGTIKVVVKPPEESGKTVATLLGTPPFTSYSIVMAGVLSTPLLPLLMGNLAPVAVIELPTRLELGDTDKVGVGMVREAEAFTPALSVTPTE
jgi:hypothetical protein